MNRRTSELRYFAGIGCRRNCSETSLRELLEQTLRTRQISLDLIAGIASIDSKRDEAGLRALADTLQLPLHFFSAAQLNHFSDRAEAISPIALLETGTANIAEACALALAESQTKQPSELIIHKCKNADSTFALAAAINKNTSNHL